MRGCEESSSDCSDSISGDKIPVFIRKIVAQKKICDTKNPVRLSHPWKSENHAVRNRFIFETVCEKEICETEKKQASNTLRRRSPGGTNFVDIFKTES